MLNYNNGKKKILELVQYIITITILIIMVFLVVFGYKVMYSNQKENNKSRVGLSYISNKIHAYDEKNMIRIEDGKYGDTLIILDSTPDGNYETRIYNYKGAIYEEYSKESKEMKCKNALKIVNSKKFQLSQEKNIINVVTDEGESIVALRAGVNNYEK